MGSENEVMAMAVVEAGSPEAMVANLARQRKQLEITRQFFSDVMVRGHDYGVIPGTEKPTLLKPGAEKLAELYGFAITVPEVREETDRETGYYRVVVTVRLSVRSTSETVAEGVGEANTYEGRYRWRWTPDWKLPGGFDPTGLRTEVRTRRSDGSSYLAYRVPNDDMAALWNTILKMAKKRALVDAVLSATRSSSMFTQDIEDMARGPAPAGDTVDAETGEIATPRGNEASANDAWANVAEAMFEAEGGLKSSDIAAVTGEFTKDAVLAYMEAHNLEPDQLMSLAIDARDDEAAG